MTIETHEGASNLVDVQTIDANIHVELKYATKDNFTGQVIYTFDRCFLQREAAVALSGAQKRLEALGLGLKVWDGFRPIWAQRKLWEACPDDRFVSPPYKGSHHSRGTAVDVTLVTKEGIDLLMPSGFDDFSEKASLRYQKASAAALRNRDLLQSVMKEAGFLSYDLEWWHFNFKDWEKFSPIEEEVF